MVTERISASETLRMVDEGYPASQLDAITMDLLLQTGQVHAWPLSDNERANLTEKGRVELLRHHVVWERDAADVAKAELVARIEVLEEVNSRIANQLNQLMDRLVIAGGNADLTAEALRGFLLGLAKGFTIQPKTMTGP